jgi:nitrous oxidase accessory protein
MDKNPLIIKYLVVGITLLFLGTTIVPSPAQDTEKSLLPTSSGKWLYVGGSGPGNYTRIQNAIKDSKDGDTIFVFAGTYYENILIKKAINLLGENANTTTIIDNFSGNESTIAIQHSNVIIKGFTIKGEQTFYAIGLYSNYITVEGNHISSDEGIYVGSSWNSILYNNITGYGLPGSLTGCGIYIDSIFSNNIIEHNSIFSGNGILIPGNHNFINDNLIVQDDCTILYGGSLNVISNNTFRGSGLQLNGVPEGIIVSNNTVNGKPLVFLDNTSNRVIDYDTGQVILVRCENVTVENQNFSHSPCCIQVLASKHCQIVNNTISYCYGEFGSGSGIAIYYSDTIMVIDNTIDSSNIQIGQWDFGYNNNIIVSRNTYRSTELGYSGIIIRNTYNCTLSYNNLVNTYLELVFYDRNCKIYSNNFINSSYINIEVGHFPHITFNRNYWEKPRLFPIFIFGIMEKFGGDYPEQVLPWLFIDWHPAQKPYDIPSMS